MSFIKEKHEDVFNDIKDRLVRVSGLDFDFRQRLKVFSLKFRQWGKPKGFTINLALSQVMSHIALRSLEAPNLKGNSHEKYHYRY